MNCPRCNQPLADRTVSLCSVQVCPGCGGVWVPFESISGVMSRLVELAPEAAAGLPAEADSRPLRCPSCGGETVRVKAQGIGGARVRTCLVCFGRWADGADLVQARGRGLVGLLRAIWRALAPKERAEPRSEAPLEAAPPPRPAPSAEESSRTEPPE